MADHHHHDASISINGRSRGSSKAQLSLQTILRTISSTNQIQAPPIPHHQSPASASSASLTSSSSSVLINVPDEMMGRAVNLERNNVGSSLHFDLNLSPPPEEEQIDISDQTHHRESQSPVVNASDGGELQENDNERILEVGPEEEDGTDYSDQTHHQDSQFPVGNAGDGGAIQEDNNERVLEVDPEEQKEDEEEEKNKRLRRLAALLDVVRIVSGDDGPSEPMNPAELSSPVDNRSTAASGATDHELTRNPRLHLECEGEEKVQKNAAEEEAVEEEPVAKEKVLGAVAETAVVRTKRGRAQVLPNKYRDSFVEPITNLSSRYNRSSSSSSSKHAPSKRRSTR